MVVQPGLLSPFARVAGYNVLVDHVISDPNLALLDSPFALSPLNPCLQNYYHQAIKTVFHDRSMTDLNPLQAGMSQEEFQLGVTWALFVRNAGEFFNPAMANPGQEPPVHLTNPHAINFENINSDNFDSFGQITHLVSQAARKFEHNLRFHVATQTARLLAKIISIRLDAIHNIWSHQQKKSLKNHLRLLLSPRMVKSLANMGYLDLNLPQFVFHNGIPSPPIPGILALMEQMKQVFLSIFKLLHWAVAADPFLVPAPINWNMPNLVNVPPWEKWHRFGARPLVSQRLLLLNRLLSRQLADYYSQLPPNQQEHSRASIPSLAPLGKIRPRFFEFDFYALINSIIRPLRDKFHSQGIALNFGVPIPTPNNPAARVMITGSYHGNHRPVLRCRAMATFLGLVDNLPKSCKRFRSNGLEFMRGGAALPVKRILFSTDGYSAHIIVMHNTADPQMPQDLKRPRIATYVELRDYDPNHPPRNLHHPDLPFQNTPASGQLVAINRRPTVPANWINPILPPHAHIQPGAVIPGRRISGSDPGQRWQEVVVTDQHESVINNQITAAVTQLEPVAVNNIITGQVPQAPLNLANQTLQARQNLKAQRNEER
ncbi:hypothetical protein HDU76_008350, partial [Blyttiomyces sp. JEL0837]